MINQLEKIRLSARFPDVKEDWNELFKAILDEVSLPDVINTIDVISDDERNETTKALWGEDRAKLTSDYLLEEDILAAVTNLEAYQSDKVKYLRKLLLEYFGTDAGTLFTETELLEAVPEEKLIDYVEQLAPN